MDILTIASIGMQSDLARMEAISHNVANALTPGFKRQISLTSSFSAEILAQASARQTRLHTDVSSTIATKIDPSSGSLRPTGNTQDVAIEGEGFLEVTVNGELRYTKQGNLRSSIDGRLVTGSGFPVVGLGGEVRVTNTPFTVSQSGEITQNGQVVGRVKLVGFDNSQSLLPQGGGLYAIGDAKVLAQAPVTSLKTGFLEVSNVSTQQEMVRLTETVRHFESLQKLVQGYDESLEKTIRKLGDF